MRVLGLLITIADCGIVASTGSSAPPADAHPDLGPTSDSGPLLDSGVSNDVESGGAIDSGLDARVDSGTDGGQGCTPFRESGPVCLQVDAFDNSCNLNSDCVSVPTCSNQCSNCGGVPINQGSVAKYVTMANEAGFCSRISCPCPAGGNALACANGICVFAPADHDAMAE